MTVVAIAGGTGHLGRTIVEALVQNKEHEVLVFSRHATMPLGSAIHVQVDYDDVASLTTLIKKRRIHTIISTIALSSDAQSNAQLNLIQAASDSTVTKRFAPSEWSLPAKESQIERLGSVEYRLRAIDLLRKTNLEYTLFFPGWLMDYYGIPHIETHMDPFPFAIDLSNRVAAIPASGDVLIVFTYTKDVARVVAASLTLERWPERAYIIGDKVTWKQLLKAAEKATGSKFQVTFNSIENLQKDYITKLPAYQEVYHS
ncbi:hypothetical protein NM208_g4620 [Fusarium decemcellulare]|uniref:Uncharacterized protein n=1 Tax=Fusarium decemcellulare TaxID=57161 RepID=A0ACC1SK48_9HYPO|nr:hypothetical protein NM208_g4620 [Fusarium decemcellulare]